MASIKFASGLPPEENIVAPAAARLLCVVESSPRAGFTHFNFRVLSFWPSSLAALLTFPVLSAPLSTCPVHRLSSAVWAPASSCLSSASFLFNRGPEVNDESEIILPL